MPDAPTTSRKLAQTLKPLAARLTSAAQSLESSGDKPPTPDILRQLSSIASSLATIAKPAAESEDKPSRSQDDKLDAEPQEKADKPFVWPADINAVEAQA